MLIVYTMGCAQSVQGMDAAEFMLVGSLGGRLHPSGYPIATYIMQLFQILPHQISHSPHPFSVFLRRFGIVCSKFEHPIFDTE